MTAIDYSVMIIYLLAMIYIGFKTSKKVKSAMDFSLGGRSIPPIIIMSSSIATAAGAGTCLGQAGRAYGEGFSALWLVIAWVIGMFILSLMAKRIFNTGGESISGVFGALHGQNAARISSIFTLIYSIGMLVSQMIGIGTVLHLILQNINLNYEICVMIGGIITILYTLQGGFYAVAYTDAAQTVILIISMVFVFPAVVISGGADVALNTVESFVFPEGTFSLFHGVTFVSLATIICKYTFSACTGIPYIQRILASRNAKEAAFSQRTASFGYLILAGVIMVFAVLARRLYPDLETPDTIVMRVIMDHFPTALAGLGIAGFFAAVMSSVDSYLLVVSQMFSHDICRWIKPDMSEKTEFKICRTSTAVFGLLALVAALNFTSILVVYEFGAAIYSSAIFFPFVLALYWKRTSTPGVIAGMIAGSAISLVFYFVPVATIDSVLLGNAVSLIATIVISLILKGQSGRIDRSVLKG